MNAMYHANTSAKKWGGNPDDYQPIHDFIDSSKSSVADVRHRAALHNAFGIFIVEKVFGNYIVNSEGKQIPVREIAEKHVLEDLGFIPSLEHWIKNMSIEPWMGGGKKSKQNTKKQQISFNNIDTSKFID